MSRKRTIDEIAKAFASDSNERGRMADAIRTAFDECPPQAFDPESIVVPVTVGNPKALYLRTNWATGNTDSGRPFEVSQSGVTLILTLGKYTDEDRITDEIRIEDLVKAWLTLRGER